MFARNKMDQRKNRTTIQISKETRDGLRNKLKYKKGKNGKHFLETYDDLLERLLNINNK